MILRAKLLFLSLLLFPAYPTQKLSAQSTPGVTANEIKIGNITCYTGWAKAYSAVARAESAYFEMINDRGGVNGRKIKFLSLDDQCDPAESLALAKQLVEQDGVLLLFSTLGTDANLALRPYLNEKQVPQLFLQSSSAIFDDPAHFPWTMGFFATYRTEGRAYAKYILDNKPTCKIAVLSANDDAGREYVAGLRDGLGPQADSLIVSALSYETSAANLDSQIHAFKASNADVFANFSIGPFVTQSIRAAADADWHPLQLIPNASLSVAAFLDPAGLPNAVGLISNARSKSWRASQAHDPAVRGFLDWMRQYNSQGDLRDQNNVAGYERAAALIAVLESCGDDLTRANVMKHASQLDLSLPMLRPGIRVKTSPTDYQPIKQLFLIRFDGKEWLPVGPVSSD